MILEDLDSQQESDEHDNLNTSRGLTLCPCLSSVAFVSYLYGTDGHTDTHRQTHGGDNNTCSREARMQLKQKRRVASRAPRSEKNELWFSYPKGSFNTLYTQY